MPGASCTSRPTPWPRPWKNPALSVWPGSFVRGEDDVHVRLHALDGERFAVEQQPVTADLRPPKKFVARVHRRLGATLRAAQTRDLRLGLRPAAVVEQILVDVELDPVGPQPI